MGGALVGYGESVMMISVLLHRGSTAIRPTHQSAGGAIASRLERWKSGGVGRPICRDGAFSFEASHVNAAQPCGGDTGSS